MFVSERPDNDNRSTFLKETEIGLVLDFDADEIYLIEMALIYALSDPALSARAEVCLQDLAGSLHQDNEIFRVCFSREAVPILKFSLEYYVWKTGDRQGSLGWRFPKLMRLIQKLIRINMQPEKGRSYVLEKRSSTHPPRHTPDRP